MFELGGAISATFMAPEKVAPADVPQKIPSLRANCRVIFSAWLPSIGIGEQMTEEEMELSRSTPGYRFDVKAAPAASGKSEEPPPVTAEAEVIESAGTAV